MVDVALSGPPETASKTPDIQRSEAPGGESKVSAAVVTINRPAKELYDFWRDFANLPQVMDNIERIDVQDGTRSHWVVNAPGGRTVEWDAIVIDDQPGRSITWQSAEGADIKNSGKIEFLDANTGRGTVVRAVIAYDPPGGTVGALIAKLFQREPALQSRRDLRRFKQLIETGEIATSSRTKAHDAEHKAG